MRHACSGKWPKAPSRAVGNYGYGGSVSTVRKRPARKCIKKGKISIFHFSFRLVPFQGLPQQVTVFNLFPVTSTLTQ